MEPNTQKPQDIVDTTDSLEAVGVCRSMKNFLFVVILICLILPQILFWLDRLGLVKPKACSSCANCKSSVSCEMSAVPEDDDQDETPASIDLMPLAATVNVAEEVERVTAQSQQSEQPEEVIVDDEIILEVQKQPDESEKEAVETAAEEVQPAKEKQEKVEVETFFKISGKVARVLVVICNFLVLIAAILYSLTLLICLKISLTGRLGGINHIARSFFISLFLLIVLIPWQRLLPGVLVGTIWLPRELFCGSWSRAQSSPLWMILFYLRFSGLWIVAVWLLFWSQNRSGKWTRATLRRLGVAR